MTDTEAGTRPDPITALRVLASLVNRDIEAQFEEIAGYSLDDVMLRLASRPATDPAGLIERIERTAYVRIGEVVVKGRDLAAALRARLSVADGPGPEERHDRGIIATAPRHDPSAGTSGTHLLSEDGERGAFSRRLDQLREEIESLRQIDSLRLDSVELRRTLEPSTLLVRDEVLGTLAAALSRPLPENRDAD